MFTGIVQEVGTITDVTSTGGGMRIRLYAPGSAQELKVDRSIAVNGVCLTVIFKNADEFDVDAVEETLTKTTLCSLAVGDHVNLELPVRLQDRMDGHMVLGHVDTVGTITGIEERASSRIMVIELPIQYNRYLIPVGSITVDGVSLTIARIEENCITKFPTVLKHRSRTRNGLR